MSSLRFYSAAAAPRPLWQRRIMRIEGRRYQRVENEDREESGKKKKRTSRIKEQILYKISVCLKNIRIEWRAEGNEGSRTLQ